MKTLLITGGAGFIGSNAVAYFLKNHPYTIINLDKLTYAGSRNNMRNFMNDARHRFIHGDITNKQLVDEIFSHYKISDVIHFAAESHVDNSIHQPDVFIRTNILGTFTLLEAAKQHWKQQPANRFLHISTDEVYGTLGETGYFTEDSPYAPNSPYSASKASSDLLVRSFFKTYGLNTVITNCSNNYGPNQHAEKFIPVIIRKALNNEPIPIYGNGKNIRDWLFVDDHCCAIDSVFHNAQAGDQFNIGANNELSNIDLALLLCENLNKLMPQEKNYQSLIHYVEDRAGHDFRYAVCTQKIYQLLKWKPTVSFEEGIAKTLAFYLQKELKSHKQVS